VALSIDGRSCGTVYVMKCFGRIVAGDEAAMMEGAMTRGLLESKRLVLDAAKVDRVDSMGMGLLVRFLSHAKKGGGDLRLSTPQPFFRTLLETTKLSTLFRIYASEEEAIVSFLKEPAASNKQAAPAGPLVLFLDQSPDLCAFVRTLLNSHGYEAISTCRLHDAKLLLNAADVACLVLGPDCSPSASQDVVASLKPLAKGANLVQLDSGFKQHDAEKAGLELLQRIQVGS
jgi:anti-anti-sigma factor